MSNFVLNDDSVLCQECYDDIYRHPLRLETPYEMIMGTTARLPCRVCNNDDTRNDLYEYANLH